MPHHEIDITQRKRAEKIQGLARDFLAALNEPLSLEEGIHRMLVAIRRGSDLDAVGIRLRKGDSYPFVDAEGFTAELLQIEETLPPRGAGCGLQDFCWRVIQGEVESGDPRFTALGSFWTNDVEPLLGCAATRPAESAQAGHCAHREFQSIALIPIRAGASVVGVLHLGARSPDALSLENVEAFEGIVAAFGVAFTRWRLMEALQKTEGSEHQLRAQARFLDHAQDAIVVQDMSGLIQFWNRGCERLTGWGTEEATHRPVRERLIVSDQDWDRAMRALGQSGSWSGELQLTARDRRTVPVISRWTLIRDDRGEAESILFINTDITEQKKLEAQFLRAQRLESIGALASGIAHDLNNVLAPVLMIAPILRETLGDSESTSMLDTIETCARRGADITRQLLTFARGTPGARVPIPIRHLLREMDKIVRETFPRDIQPSIILGKDLWCVLGDATQLHQAIMNLCLNSRDAMPDGGTLTLEARNCEVDEAFAAMTPGAQAGPYVRLTVSDTGTGIPREHLDRVFDPFFTTKDVGTGTGLGLASVLGIVRGHGGFIRFSSDTGRGTLFELYFPATVQASSSAAADSSSTGPRGEGQVILVVDDEPSVRSSIERMLTRRGYRPLTATQGAEALAIFTQHRAEIRAVLTDMMMPVMNGPALVHALRHIAPEVPVVGMTGLPERSGIKGLDQLALAALLIKPFPGNTLIRTLHEILGTPPPPPAPAEAPPMAEEGMPGKASTSPAPS